MTLNSFSDGPEIDFNENEPNLTLNHWENYFSSLVNELDSDLSFLQSDDSCNESSNYSISSSLIKCHQRESPISLFTNQSRASFYENNDEVPYNLLTAAQIQRIIDYYKQLLKIPEVPSYRDTSYQLFGSSISSIQKHTGGLALPHFIEDALIYLTRYGINSVGIFRKSGVKARIMAIRQKLEQINERDYDRKCDFFKNNPLCNLGDEFCVYDIADVVKMWLREIKPRPLISKEIIALFKESTADLGLKLSVLLSDAQRAVLEIFLHFLSWFANNSSVNQMNARNLAICFTPSLCECSQTSPTVIRSNESSSSGDSFREAEPIYAAQACLEYLIVNCSTLTLVSTASLPFPITLNGSCSSSEKITLSNCSSSSLINGGNLLPPKYESTIIVTASPNDILKRILYQRNSFDPSIIEWKILQEDENSDLFEYKVQSSIFLPVKTFTLDRKWTFIDREIKVGSNLKKKKESCKGVVISESGYLYDAHWKIMTYGEGKSQLHISIAADLRGHSYHWYSYTFPRIIDWQLLQIKQSFIVDMIETKQLKSTSI